MTAPGSAGRRVAVLGDSWIRGLGPERRNAFGKLIAHGIGATDVLDLSAISRTAPDFAAEFLETMRDFQPDIAIVNLGGADSLIFPAWPVQRFIDRFAPPRWHGVEGLMPIARYSSDKRRRRRQRIENFAKIVLKQVVVNVLGGRRRVSVADFEQATRTVMTFLHRQGTSMVVLGIGTVDPLLSPKTNRSVDKTNAVLIRLCEEVPGAIFVPTTPHIHRWGDYLSDHVHLNREGHRHVADGVLADLKQRSLPWLATEHEVSA